MENLCLNFNFNQETGNCEISLDYILEKYAFFDAKLNPIPVIGRNKVFFNPKNEPKYCLIFICNFDCPECVIFHKLYEIDYIYDIISFEALESKNYDWAKNTYNKYHQMEVNKMLGEKVEEDESIIGEDVTLEDLMRQYVKMHFKNCF